MLLIPDDVRQRMSTLTRRSLTLHAIDCSPDELDEINCLGEDSVRKVEELVTSLLHAKQEIPEVAALCFGESASYDWLPERVRSTRRPHDLGVWLRTPSVIMVFMDHRGRADGVILHELTHALQDLLSDRFPYPMVLTEGFACTCEVHYTVRRISTRVHPYHWGRGSATGGFLTPDEYMSIRDLLAFKYPVDDEDRSRLIKFHRASYWFIAFLQIAYLKSHPRVRRIMVELRQQGVKTPEGVIGWLESACERSLDRMEEESRDHCLGPDRGATAQSVG